MKIKNQVVALPEAKKLDPLLPKDFKPAFRWWRRRHKGQFGKPDYWGKWFVDKSDITIEAENESFAAPTMPEVLFGLLPEVVWIDDIGYMWDVTRLGISFIPTFRKSASLRGSTFMFDMNNPATAAAMLFRWLKEEGHV